ncbi:MAG TPA: hypothetical protein PK765_03075 [bacterium]|nr:hypothetical protein [bacterium]
MLKLDLYDEEELARIARRSMSLLGYDGLPNEAVSLIARRGRGTPRIVNRYAKILRDYATVGRDIASPEAISSVFMEIGVDNE